MKRISRATNIFAKEILKLFLFLCETIEILWYLTIFLYFLAMYSMATGFADLDITTYSNIYNSIRDFLQYFSLILLAIWFRLFNIFLLFRLVKEKKWIFYGYLGMQVTLAILTLSINPLSIHPIWYGIVLIKITAILMYRDLSIYQVFLPKFWLNLYKKYQVKKAEESKKIGRAHV